jgi:SynChlorMet cassette protein ScmC
MIRLWRQKNAPNIICEMEAPRNWFEEVTVIWHALRTVYEDVYALGGLPLHGALVERNGCGALLVGDSGMGKSTCCKRIISPWSALADEEVVLLPDGLNRFSCYPFPTSGQLLEPPQSFADLSLQQVPLAAIFFLEQTPRDRIQRIGQGQTALRLKRSTNPIFGFRARSGHQAFQSNAKKLAFTNASAVAQAVPGFMLGVSLTGRFWELMDEVLDHGKGQQPRNDPSGPMIRGSEGLMKAHQYNL